jgi:predicted signal transduction protein with EAL and GGDEF domain
VYQAKEKGRNTYQFFHKNMDLLSIERRAIEENLRIAPEKKQEFILYYRPIVNLNSGIITGAEALVRWMHPKWGLVPPAHHLGVMIDAPHGDDGLNGPQEIRDGGGMCQRLY